MDGRLAARPKAEQKQDLNKEKLAKDYPDLKDGDDGNVNDVDQSTRKNNVVGVQSLLSFLILCSAWLVGFSSRLFAVVRFESIIHEFDPW